MVIVRKNKVSWHVMKACKGNRGITPLVHDLGASWKWLAIWGPSHFLPRNKLRYHLKRKLAAGGFTACLDAQDKRNIYFPYWDSNPWPSIPQPSQYTDCAPKARLTQHPATLFGAPTTLGPHAAAHIGHWQPWTFPDYASRFGARNIGSQPYDIWKWMTNVIEPRPQRSWN
jgi:hypothetical protein